MKANIMNYSIIGFGEIGSAIARAFARKEIKVAVAGRRTVQKLTPLAARMGKSVVPGSMKDALDADLIILAVPFWAHKDVARTVKSWQGKIIIDATNAFGIPQDDLGGLPSSAVVAAAFPDAHLVKAFNHLPAGVLAEGAGAQGGRRVVFVSGDDAKASAQVAELVEQLGFAPVELGKLTEGGMLIQARGQTWGQLIFQDLVKFN